MASGSAIPLVLGSAAPRSEVRESGIDAFIAAERRSLRLPGLAACLIKSGRVAWSKGYGWSDIAKRVPMDPDRTVQNIGSISKTVVATAVMQLWEKGEFQLDDDVNHRLPFAVRNPSHPSTPITYRHLLTHRSGIADSVAYQSSYACGEPRLSLDDWLRGYFEPGGRYNDKQANFHPWKPGEKSAYSNLGFGLLGYLVERISGEPFSQYTSNKIFKPLGMMRTGWLLSEVDVVAHAVPYVPAADGDSLAKELEVYRKQGLLAGETVRDPLSGEHRPLCLYSFPNYPDGSLRTSVNQLAQFLLTYINDGVFGEARLLAADTIRLMLTPQTATTPMQGLCWTTQSRDGQRHWGHGGSDPGVRTAMSFRPSDGVGVIVFVNRSGVDLSRISDRLFREAVQI
jgi:CubicO group peptidase (beta-lactamase class C family)